MIETLVCIDYGPRGGYGPDLDGLIQDLGDAVKAVREGTTPHYRTRKPMRVVRIAFDAAIVRNTDAHGFAHRRAWVSSVEPGDTTAAGVDERTLGPVGYDYALLIAERRSDGRLKGVRWSAASDDDATALARQWGDAHPAAEWRTDAFYVTEARVDPATGVPAGGGSQRIAVREVEDRATDAARRLETAAGGPTHRSSDAGLAL